MCNHVAHSLLVFLYGLFPVPLEDIDSRVRHAYFCASICAKIRTAHSNMSDKVGSVPHYSSVGTLSYNEREVRR